MRGTRCGARPSGNRARHPSTRQASKSTLRPCEPRPGVESLRGRKSAQLGSERLARLQYSDDRFRARPNYHCLVDTGIGPGPWHEQTAHLGSSSSVNESGKRRHRADWTTAFGAPQNPTAVVTLSHIRRAGVHGAASQSADETPLQMMWDDYSRPFHSLGPRTNVGPARALPRVASDSAA